MKKIINYLRNNREDILGTIAVICATSATIAIINMIY